MKGGEKMNAIAMLFQQGNVNARLMGENKQPTDDLNKEALFHALLARNQAVLKDESNPFMSFYQGNPTLPSNQSQLELQALLTQLFLGRDDASLETIPGSEGEGISDLGSEGVLGILLDDKATTQEQGELLDKLLAEVEKLGGLNTLDLEAIRINPILVELIQIVKEAHSLLKGIVNEQDMKQVAPKLLTLLNQWEMLSKKTSATPELAKLFDALPNEEKRLNGIWKELVQAFHKRNQFASNKLYAMESKVSSQDVAKWVANAIESTSMTVDRPVLHTVPAGHNIPMSKVEQYVLYINQPQHSPTAETETMDQLQRIVQSSRFLTTPGGKQQLSIMLRPENLGEMMVRFTQINGEMAVKILVSSHAAKEMLEKNMHQLKHMFSPHQVVVEKQEITLQSSQSFTKEQQGEQMLKEQQQNESGDAKEQQQQQEENAELQFSDFLMNEKV